MNDIEFKCLIDSKIDAVCVAFLTVKLEAKESRKRWWSRHAIKENLRKVDNKTMISKKRVMNFHLLYFTHPRKSIGPFTSLWSKITIFNQEKKCLRLIKTSIFWISTDRNSLKSIPIYFCVKMSSGSENTSF